MLFSVWGGLLPSAWVAQVVLRALSYVQVYAFRLMGADADGESLGDRRQLSSGSQKRTPKSSRISWYDF
jgi:hypothetical protein